jgi:hypothetical protein
MEVRFFFLIFRRHLELGYPFNFHTLFTPSARSSLVSRFHPPSGTALNRALSGKSEAPLIMCPDWRNLLLFTTQMTFGLLNSLSSSKFYLLLHTISTILGPYIVRITFLSKTSNRLFSLFVSTHVSLPYSF